MNGRTGGAYSLKRRGRWRRVAGRKSELVCHQHIGAKALFPEQLEHQCHRWNSSPVVAREVENLTFVVQQNRAPGAE